MQAVSVTTPIFIIIAIGYFFKRRGWLSSSTMREVNRFLYWLAMPCLLIRNIFSADMSILRDYWLPVLLNLPCLIVFFVSWSVGKFYREEPKRLSVTVMSSVRSNQIFVGFPIAFLAFGDAGLEAAAIFLALTLVFFQLFSIGGAQLALEGEFSWRAFSNTFKTLLKNPLFVVTIISITLVLSGFNHPPKWAEATIKILADIGSGMALIMVGTEVVFDNLGQKLRRVQKILFMRLILYPFITYAILRLYGAPQILTNVATLLSGTPIAFNSLIVAKGMGMDAEYMADAVISSTVLSMFSITIMLQLMGV